MINLTYVSVPFYNELKSALALAAIGHYSCIGINEKSSSESNCTQVTFSIYLYQEDDDELDEKQAIDMAEDLTWQAQLIRSLNRIKITVCNDFDEEYIEEYPDSSTMENYLGNRDIRGLISYINEFNAGIEPFM